MGQRGGEDVVTGGEASLRCGGCGAELERDHRFCPACGEPTAAGGGIACPACGLAQPRDAIFCSRCGAHLGSLGRAERRVITVLFADLSGFTRITEKLDPEAVHELARSCLEPLAECAIRWGGHVDKFIGDSVMALFGVPEGHEDEPERAVRAALEMQRTLEAWSPDERHAPELAGEARPRLGVGINTGPVVTGLLSAGSACDYTALGDVVNVASRLESACEPGEVLVGEKTWRETRDVFEFDEGEVMEVPGRREPVRARRVLGEKSVRPGGPVAGGRARPLVDRREELGRLRRAWGAAREGEATTLLVAGEPGVGKTRLVEELVAVEGLEAGQVARVGPGARAAHRPWELAAGLAAALHGLPRGTPPEEAAAAVAGERSGAWSEAEVTALAEVFAGRGGDGPVEGAGEGAGDEASAAVARALSGPGGPPRLLLMEDLHRADRSTLGWLAEGAPGLEGARLLLALARPPLPRQTGLAAVLAGPLPRLDVEPLDDRDARTLLETLLGDHRLPDDLLDRVLRRAEGNPFYLEETLEALSDRGAIEREEGSWRLAAGPDRPGAAGVPDGVESLLSTRMDALPSSTKRLLQCASVAGRRFWGDLLADELLERPVEEDLRRLREAGMIRTAREPRIPGEREHVFEHVLLREVAYGTLLRSVRAELHGSVAAWLEERPDAGIRGYHRTVARHWERAGEPGRAAAHREEAEGT